jgi:uncharacterized protein involved in outer membrane biogenesis
MMIPFLMEGSIWLGALGFLLLSLPILVIWVVWDYFKGTMRKIVREEIERSKSENRPDEAKRPS